MWHVYIYIGARSVISLLTVHVKRLFIGFRGLARVCRPLAKGKSLSTATVSFGHTFNL